MTDRDRSLQTDEFWKATEAPNQWLQGAFALALLRAALASGILEAARGPRSADEIASATGVDRDAVADACEGLAQLGVMQDAGGRFRLAPAFLVLTAPDAPQTLENWIGINGVYLRALEQCLEPPKAYQELGAEEIVRVARGAWGLPSSPQALASFAEVDASVPEIREVWRCGGRHMELGCGVGRDLLRIAVSYPKVTVTGVDMNREVLDEVLAQARELGIGDRVQVRCCDARRVADAGAYDTIVWSQLFFPPETRAETVGVAFRALRPGGYVLLPLLKDSPLSRLIYRRWGLRYFRAEEVRGELERGGFEFLRLIAHPRMDYMVARAPAPR